MTILYVGTHNEDFIYNSMQGLRVSLPGLTISKLNPIIPYSALNRGPFEA